MIGSILNEYGVEWIFHRGLYYLKLKMLRACPQTEKLFEKDPKVQRLNIFDIDIIELQHFLMKLPVVDRDQIIREADEAAKGKIIGFSSVELDYGQPIDWQLNPMTVQQADVKQKWYRIPDFDPQIGDIKAIWEISRFSHLVTLARAYLLTENKKYCNVFSEQIDQWLDNNPYSYGANYKCGQECSIRMVNVLLAYTVFASMGVATERDDQNVRRMVQHSYRKVLSNFFYAYKCIKNNHTISELMGMVIGAWCCRDEHQLDKAYDYLDKVIRDQFTEDGGYSQFSFNYQRLALMDLNVIMSLSGKTSRDISKDSKQRIRNAAMLLYQCQTANHDVPNYGSNDGALIFRLTACGYRDFRPVCNTTFRLLCGTELYDHDKHREELIWLGYKGDTILKEDIAHRDLFCLQAGIFTLRRDNAMMMLVCNNYQKRPGHMDQMHVDLWVDGLNVLCDSGTYSYASQIGQVLLDSKSHNTVTVEGKPQMSICPPFLVYHWPERMSVMRVDDGICARMKFKSGYMHERTIHNRAWGFVIEDCIVGNEADTTWVNFHTICDIESDGKTLRFSYNGKIICYMQVELEYKIIQSERSLYYLKKESVNCISIRMHKNKITTNIVMEDN